ncbi:hypothetical protein FOZ63_013081 [Perkinsus olseni]|uniref:Uncharacterized protein n=2 Tax=Perkinsus olseni TaxID=32597 RepID=A0A7J6RAX8_PEROL|nr:hypothetical protein FOZ63_013081 [Perkinsus olseni]
MVCFSLKWLHRRKKPLGRRSCIADLRRAEDEGDKEVVTAGVLEVLMNHESRLEKLETAVDELLTQLEKMRKGVVKVKEVTEVTSLDRLKAPKVEVHFICELYKFSQSQAISTAIAPDSNHARSTVAREPGLAATEHQ